MGNASEKKKKVRHRNCVIYFFLSPLFFSLLPPPGDLRYCVQRKIPLTWKLYLSFRIIALNDVVVV